MTTLAVGYQDTHDPVKRYNRWTPDATGHTYVTVTVDEDHTNLTIEIVAEAVFEADNAPYALQGLSGEIADQLRAAPAHHSFSIGDRVRFGALEAICASDGWIIEEAAAA